jgi:hypothetical protein
LYQRSAKRRQDPARIAYESNRDLVKLNDPGLEAVDAEKMADVERREAAIQSFRKYYKLQAIVPEDEFELLMRSLFKPLPVSFRECPVRPQPLVPSLWRTSHATFISHVLHASHLRAY